ncbi:hypothetical protein BV22DRAFT_1105519 [Leucogyrophana mollusca]|uniref:Uncharacterized protein n=1 Tax=Leucogyrophana mollusca TaxID=85980 RepID=A0ACB8BF44_9AGAM|nr:hypothetical protein BV22DRAFT_1105519 [Leucogyrophana mollusca]
MLSNIAAPSANAFLFTSLALAAAWIYNDRRRKAPSGLSETFFSALVLLHTVFILWSLTLQRPPNLFTRLGIPVTTPTEHIRSLLLREAGVAGGSQAALTVATPLPNDLEFLLNKLSIADSRLLYTRFGQRALQTCQYCSSTFDYTLFVFSRALLAYVRTAFVVLLLTAGANNRERWRTFAVGALACAALAEGYILATTSAGVSIPKNGKGAFMWHDTLFLARNAVFLLIPLLIHLQPALARPGPPSAGLLPVLAHLERSLPRAHLIKYARGAIMRRAELRAPAVRWWAREAREGEAGRADEDVQRTAERVGLGFDDATGAGASAEGKLRTSARMAVEALKGVMAHPAG